MSLSGRLVSCVSMPFVPPAYGSLGSIDSSKIQPDQPHRAICLTFASGDCGHRPGTMRMAAWKASGTLDRGSFRAGRAKGIAEAENVVGFVWSYKLCLSGRHPSLLNIEM